MFGKKIPHYELVILHKPRSLRKNRKNISRTLSLLQYYPISHFYSFKFIHSCRHVQIKLSLVNTLEKFLPLFISFFGSNHYLLNKQDSEIDFINNSLPAYVSHTWNSKGIANEQQNMNKFSIVNYYSVWYSLYIYI